MDILASIIAYLGCVAGIIGAFAISLFVLFSTPDQTTPAKPTAAQSVVLAAKTNVLKTNVLKPAVTAEAKSAPGIKQTVRHVAAGAAKPATASPTTLAGDLRQKPSISRSQLRRLVQEERAKRWAYQQDSNFDNRFLGYAD